jgi:hypothetical protein
MVNLGALSGAFHTRHALPLAIVATWQQTLTLASALVIHAIDVNMANHSRAVMAMRYFSIDQSWAFH